MMQHKQEGKKSKATLKCGERSLWCLCSIERPLKYQLHWRHHNSNFTNNNWIYLSIHQSWKVEGWENRRDCKTLITVGEEREEEEEKKKSASKTLSIRQVLK